MRDILKLEDIEALIKDGILEDKELEYKSSLPGAEQQDRVEFLADVTAFANTVGGQIVYGVRDDSGLPSEIVGIENQALDQAKLRLDDLIRNSVQPKLFGVEFRAIPVTENASVLLITIPRSLAAPHVVSNSRHWRFYGRRSGGKYPLDVQELRTAFVGSENIAERLRQFRAQRLFSMQSNQGPLKLNSGGLLVLHLLPMNLGVHSQVVDIRSIIDGVTPSTHLAPIYGSASTQRFNLDGFLTYHSVDESTVGGYLQLFTHGAIEVVDSVLMKERGGDDKYLPSLSYEEELRSSLEKYLEVMRRIGVQTPIACMVSLLNVRNYKLGVNQRIQWRLNVENKVDRDDLIIPETIIDSYDLTIDQILRPIFDIVWNSFGYYRSFNYSDTGEWRPNLWR